MTIGEMFNELENKVRDTVIVTLKYKYDFEEEYTIENQILEYDALNDDYVWLNDWREGQTDIEVLGYMLLGDVDTAKPLTCEDCISRQAMLDEAIRGRRMTLEEFIAYFDEQSERFTFLVPYDADENYNKNCKQLADLLRELEAYRKFYSLDNDIKTTLNEIHDIHERIRQCNERYEQRMAELERPVVFYDINGPLKITREEDNNG